MSYWEDNRPRPESPIDETESDTLSIWAAAAVRVLAHTNLDECLDDAITDTGDMIATILETVIWRENRKFYEQQDQRNAEEKEKERLKAAVETYFDPATDAAKRAQLEELISDEDFAAELHTIKYQEKTWSLMAKQNEERLKLVNELKAKRTESVAA